MFESKDGFVFDARNAPREIQEELFEAGMIPFIPLPKDNEIIGTDLKEADAKKSKTKNSLQIEGQMNFDD